MSETRRNKKIIISPVETEVESVSHTIDYRLTNRRHWRYLSTKLTT